MGATGVVVDVVVVLLDTWTSFIEEMSDCELVCKWFLASGNIT